MPRKTIEIEFTAEEIIDILVKHLEVTGEPTNIIWDIKEQGEYDRGTFERYCESVTLIIPEK